MAFKAALFDMDGTLLDSMDVWAQVDEEFFRARGMTTPDDYGPALAGLSLRQSAEYTKARFNFPESIDEIIAEWNSLCEVQYREQVTLKPGAARYLRMLKRHGVKIAAATALEPHLFVPALMRLGVHDLFDAFATVSETDQPKISGAVYTLAAQRLGVVPEDCIVYEDILEGHLGARAAGMRSCNVYDRHANRNRKQIMNAADFFTRDFTAGTPLPDWTRAVIVPAWPESGMPFDEIRPGDCIIAADRGCHLCRRAGIEPDFCLGDYDSLLPGEAAPPHAMIYPSMKDATDTALALDFALQLGIREILLLGGTGGRLDHTIANLQLMRLAADKGADMRICAPDSRMRLLPPGRHVLPAIDSPALFSLFAFTPEVRGLTICGAKYTLDNGSLSDSFPLGISNERLPDVALEIKFTSGRLLLIEPV